MINLFLGLVGKKKIGGGKFAHKKTKNELTNGERKNLSFLPVVIFFKVQIKRKKIRFIFLTFKF